VITCDGGYIHIWKYLVEFINISVIISNYDHEHQVDTEKSECFGLWTIYLYLSTSIVILK
jgi:hypothetical protein